MIASKFFLRTSQALHSMMGGFAIFCLYYAAILSDYDMVKLLITYAFEWGGMAAAIIYFQGKYLSDV